MAHSESVGISLAGAGGNTAQVTASVATAAAALAPLLVWRELAASVLMKLPHPGAVTFTVTLQDPGVVPTPAGIVRVAGSVTVLPPGVAATAPLPPHVVLAFGTGATMVPPGNVSVSAAVSVAT